MPNLTDLCQYLHNWFELSRHAGTFEIRGGALTVPFLQNGQYYRIVKSAFNDGVHKYGDPTDVLDDETFNGGIWALGIPKKVIALAEEIDAWREKYENLNSEAMSPFASESFGGYSYNKGSNSTGQGGSSINVGWQGVFASRLYQWRKI